MRSRVCKQCKLICVLALNGTVLLSVLYITQTDSYSTYLCIVLLYYNVVVLLRMLSNKLEGCIHKGYWWHFSCL